MTQHSEGRRYRCVAVTEKGRCLLENDHEGDHCFEPAQVTAFDGKGKGERLVDDPFATPQMTEAVCAHLKVQYRTETVGSFTRGWWECDLCDERFVPEGVNKLADDVAKDDAWKPIPPANPNRFPGMDEGDDALRTIRELVEGIRSHLAMDAGAFDGARILADLQCILNQEVRLRAYISGLKAR